MTAKPSLQFDPSPDQSVEADQSGARDDSCYHCGLPLDPALNATTDVLGKTREFCCHGCLAVARGIVDAGLQDYYAYREEKAVTADVVPDILRKLEFYDHPDVQRSFVRHRASAREASLLLENIRCAACLWLNERVLRGLDGVLDVELDYASHHARIRWDPARIKLSEILQSIVDIGYIAHPYDAARRENLNAQQRKRSTERLIFAAVIGMVVMNFAIAGYVMGLSDETGELALWVRIGRWTSLIAATALLAYPGQEFFVGAWHDLRNRRLGMDTPIVLGLSVAYLGSLHTTWTGSGEVYYDSIAMFVFLVLLARRIELRGRIKAADALDRANKVLPRLAHKVVADGERDVLVTDLEPGDRVVVHPGESVPTDGTIVAGASSFDESPLTGESLPVDHAGGDAVIGGSCNVDQTVTVEVSRDSASSTVAEIHRLLSAGMRDAPRYVILAQQAAGWFVAVVLLIALATAAVWLLLEPDSALRNTVAVLIVTCPCALALATPVAAATGVGRLADIGVLTVRSDALEILAHCQTFAFDKTGTLTRGEMQAGHIQTFGPLDAQQALSIAAALEHGSTHPIGRSLHQAVHPPVSPAAAIHIHPGEGIEGRVDKSTWRIGRPSFALRGSEHSELGEAIARQRARGAVVIALADQNGSGALIELDDSARPGAESLANELRALGIGHVALLSGDDQAGVDRFAPAQTFDTAQGNMSPTDKLAWIRQRQARGERVAMIGDGVNDAPTLAAADVSVSFADATQLAQLNSGLLILGSELAIMPQTRSIAEKTRAIILQNLVWAAGYNFAAVPAAAMGYIPPWGAAIGMSLSSLLVVLNALRLRRV